MESELLDFSKPLNVALLDSTVDLFYTSSKPEEARASRPVPL